MIEVGGEISVSLFTGLYFAAPTTRPLPVPALTVVAVVLGAAWLIPLALCVCSL